MSQCVSKHKQVMCVQPAALCYVPATRNYWVTGQHGNVQAFDPRAPGDVTPFIKATRSFRALYELWLLCICCCNPRVYLMYTDPRWCRFVEGDCIVNTLYDAAVHMLCSLCSVSNELSGYP